MSSQREASPSLTTTPGSADDSTACGCFCGGFGKRLRALSKTALGFRHNSLRLNPAHADSKPGVFERDAGDLRVLNALAGVGMPADIPQPELPTEGRLARFDGRRTVENHQAEVSLALR